MAVVWKFLNFALLLLLQGRKECQEANPVLPLPEDPGEKNARIPRETDCTNYQTAFPSQAPVDDFTIAVALKSALAWGEGCPNCVVVATVGHDHDFEMR